MPDARTHSVYVIELDKAVRANRRFANANPECRADRPCLYVGLTGRSPEERFAQHKAGIKAARFVRAYGIRLRPRLYGHHNPMTYDDAQKMEVELARRLRKRGFAVWQN